jgi:tryptophan 2,3-dioxygenase
LFVNKQASQRRIWHAVAVSTDDVDQILPGPDSTDYQNYLRTSELLSLQKPAEERAHRDELLFEVTHQASELWLKLAVEDLREARSLLESGATSAAVRMLNRLRLAISLCEENLDMLELMTPWEYQKVRTALGHGSGFDSPGFNALRSDLPTLFAPFEQLLTERGLTLTDMYRDHADNEDLFALAEALMDVDEALLDWRARHVRVIERSIGFDVSGTQGTPVEVVANLRDRKTFPALWEARTHLSRMAEQELDFK